MFFFPLCIAKIFTAMLRKNKKQNTYFTSNFRKKKAFSIFTIYYNVGYKSVMWGMLKYAPSLSKFFKVFIMKRYSIPRKAFSACIMWSILSSLTNGATHRGYSHVRKWNWIHVSGPAQKSIQSRFHEIKSFFKARKKGKEGKK